MEFKQLELFLSVANCGSFTEAARTTYISQPTISMHIAALEKELGVALFERRGRETVLTPAGKVFFEYALDLVRLKEKSIAALHRYQREIAGRLQIAASTTPSAFILPGLIPAFLSKYPRVFIEISQEDSQEVWQKVLNYRAELGVVGALGNESDIDYLPFVHEELLVITPPLFPFNEWPNPVSRETILEQPFVFRESGSGTQKTFEQALAKEGIPSERLNIKARFASIEGVKRAVAAGLGIGVISEFAAEKELQFGLLKGFRVADLNLRRQFYIIHHKKRVLSPTAERFREFILEQAKLSNLELP